MYTLESMGLWRRRVRGIETLCWLLAARIVVRVLPFRVIAARLGGAGAESPHDIPSADAARAREIGSLLRAVCRRVGWHPSCLVRSTAAMMLLRRRRLEGTLYLGVAREADQPLRAHAWVRCGDVFVTGGKQKDSFTVLGSFTRSP